MTDLGVPSDERSETVTRVLAALSSGTTDGGLERDALREALASEGQSLLDLPEVGLWLALTQISLTEAGNPLPPFDFELDDRHVIDLRDRPVDITDFAEVTERLEAPDHVETIDFPAPVEVEPAAPIEMIAPPVPAPPPERERHRPRRLARRRRRMPPIVVSEQPPTPASWMPGAWPATVPDTAVPEPTMAPEPIDTTAIDTTAIDTTAIDTTAVDATAAESGGTEASILDDAPDDRPAEAPEDEAGLEALHAFLATALSDPLHVDLGDGATAGGATVLESDHLTQRTLRWSALLVGHLESALESPILVVLPDPTAAGRAIPDTYLPRSLDRSLQSLREHLEESLRLPIVLDLADPSKSHGATLDAYWPRSVVQSLARLDDFLGSLFSLPTVARVPASRLAGASNGAVPDPYWPRHLVRVSPSIVDDRPTPRSPEDLEIALHEVLDEVALVGEADLEPFAAELEIALAQLVRRVPLDRLGRIYPATLAAFLVRQTVLHPQPADFDANVPVTALRRTNPVGLAFSEALIRLAKPVFREVEQRDEFDHRVRYLRRMQLHGGIPDEQLTAVLAAIDASYWAGAASGREVAQDWLSASSAVTATIGGPTFRLLTRTDHGALMLEALLDLVRWRSLDPAPTEPPPGLDPLPASLVARAWESLQHLPHPEVNWGDSPRPRIRLGASVGAGPEVELPPSSSRWHLNGELLTYGSPTHRKSVALPTTRGGKWAVTVGATRRTSPFDIGIQSAAPDRIVLVFDELDRSHHHTIPLGGTGATVVAPAGSRVTGEKQRTLLLGRWIGYERIEVDLTAVDELVVSQRGHEPVTIVLDRRLQARLSGGRADDGSPLLTFRGHVPPPMTVEVLVDDGVNRRSSLLTDLWVTPERGAFGLGNLVSEATDTPITVTVSRIGFDPVVDTLTLQVPAPSPVAPGPTGPTTPAEPSGLALVRAAFQGSTSLGADDLEQLWDLDPVLAAATDRWDVEPDGRIASARWARLAGWTPPSNDDRAMSALSMLLRPVVAVLGDERAPTEPAAIVEGAPWLSIDGWTSAIGTDLEALGEWGQRHRRPLARWRGARPSLKNLDPLWAPVQRSSRAGIILPVVAAGLLTFADGPHRAMAAERLAEAIVLAPALTIPTTILAIAYLHTQRVHPETRFRPIDLRRA